MTGRSTNGPGDKNWLLVVGTAMTGIMTAAAINGGCRLVALDREVGVNAKAITHCEGRFIELGEEISSHFKDAKAEVGKVQEAVSDLNRSVAALVAIAELRASGESTYPGRHPERG